MGESLDSISYAVKAELCRAYPVVDTKHFFESNGFSGISSCLVITQLMKSVPNCANSVYSVCKQRCLSVWTGIDKAHTLQISPNFISRLWIFVFFIKLSRLEVLEGLLDVLENFHLTESPSWH